MSSANTLGERQVAALAYAIAQIAACCVFFAIAEIAIAHGELGSIFRLVYISTSLSLVASIVTMAYYIKKSWFYKIAMGVNGKAFMDTIALSKPGNSYSNYK
ncbi:hypothetical protein DdX_20863 [Ditylenchus destructor]|uniref:Uncharacterized protein n=1 Tax=Ditylenchus destructor TaxID=166010 RepID=A0AAD4MFP6_9BILA|nr:hypothetical protein DdX_20863 [Ditylenchus destructor]